MPNVSTFLYIMFLLAMLYVILSGLWFAFSASILLGIICLIFSPLATICGIIVLAGHIDFLFEIAKYLPF